MRKAKLLRKVYKSEVLNKGNFKKFCLNDYRVFLLLLSKIKRGTDSSANNFVREYELTAQEFSEAFKIKLRVCYSSLKKSVHKLFKSDITIYKPEIKESWIINVCSMAKYNDSYGSIKIEFSDKIIPHLIRSSQRYILYPLEAVSNFHSLYSIRLYEVLMGFKSTGWMVKSVEELRKILGAGEQLKLYSNFKKKAIVHSCKEINFVHDLGLRFEEIKFSKKVVSLKFFFKKIVKSEKNITDDIVDVGNSVLQIPSFSEV